MVTTLAEVHLHRQEITDFLRYVSVKRSTKAGKIINSTEADLKKIDFLGEGYLADNARAEVMNAKMRLIDALAATHDVEVCRSLIWAIERISALHAKLGEE